MVWEARFYPIPNLELGVMAGYARYWGTPEFNFEIYRDEDLVQLDKPVDSDLNLFHLDGQVGGRIANLGGGPNPWGLLLAWEMGACRVSQRSKIDFEKYNEGGGIAGTGRREDVLTRWRGSMGFSGEIDHTFSNGFMLGFEAGIQSIYWKPKEEESLAIDWLEGDFINLFHCGLSLGFAYE